MNEVSKFVMERVKVINEFELKSSEDLKPVSTRMTADEVEKMSSCAQFLEMSKSEFIRAIVSKACDDIIKEYKLVDGERIGMSHVEMLEFEQMSPEEKEKFIAKIQAEAAARNEGEVNE